MAKTQLQRLNFTLLLFPSTDPESTEGRGYVKNLEHKSGTDRPNFHHIQHNNTQFHP